MISGVALEFETQPIQKSIPRPFGFKGEKRLKIDAEIFSMLRRGIIEKTNHSPGEYISNIFTRDKKDGSIRIILDLTELNKHIKYRHFKMDTLQSVLDLVYPNCYMASIDWKDAYYSVPIRDVDRKFLRFQWGNQLFQYTCLPNGLASAPRIFTKVTRVFFAELRKKGHLNSSFIDDSFLVGSKNNCRLNVIDTFDYSDKAGWVVHPEKSMLDPEQERIHLGVIINSVKMTVSLTEERKAKMTQSFMNVLENQNNVKIRKLAEAVGLMVASFPAVVYGKLYYRRCDNFKTLALKQNQGNYEARVRIPAGACDDLRWWLHNTPSSYAPIRRKSPEIELTSDASKIGWGGTCGNSRTGGNWTVREKDKHINELELKAALFTIKAFCYSMRNKHVLIRIDNTNAVIYINNQGGRSEGCNCITRELWL